MRLTIASVHTAPHHTSGALVLLIFPGRGPTGKFGIKAHSDERPRAPRFCFEQVRFNNSYTQCGGRNRTFVDMPSDSVDVAAQSGMVGRAQMVGVIENECA